MLAMRNYHRRLRAVGSHLAASAAEAERPVSKLETVRMHQGSPLGFGVGVS